MAWKNDQVSVEETKKILEVARDSLEVEGDFVELGCYKGDTSLLLAEVLRDFNTKPVEKTVENFVKKVGANVLTKVIACATIEVSRKKRKEST